MTIVNQQTFSTAPRRLLYLDGVRGAAALYVTLYHALGDELPPGALIRTLLWPLQYGHYAVGVFLVLSGYCLMLPVMSSPNLQLRGGIKGYLKRRLLRLLPAYYVVLLVAVCAVAVVNRDQARRTGEEADALLLTAGSVVSHLLLLHNLHPRWFQSFDPPMWSIALEWQVSLLFPVLLALWRRSNMALAAALALGLSFGPHLLLPPAYNLDWTFPWLVSLFMMGMYAAALQPGKHALQACRVMAPLLLVAVIVYLAPRPSLPIGDMWLPDLALGGGVACALVRLRASGTIRFDLWSALRSLFERRTLTWIGQVSYSLYLVHAPVLWLVSSVCHSLSLGALGGCMVRLIFGPPLAIAAAVVLNYGVERRFQPKS